jgi:hypothetical protein
LALRNLTVNWKEQQKKQDKRCVHSCIAGSTDV